MILAGMVFYIFAQLLKCFRFWYLITDNTQISFRRIFYLFFSSSLLGHLTHLFFSEGLRIIYFIFLPQNIYLLLSYILTRAFDFFILGILAIILTSLNQLSALQATAAFSTFSSLTLLSIIILVPTIARKIQYYLFSKESSHVNLNIYKFISKVKKASLKIENVSYKTYLVLLCLSLCIWILEILSIMFFVNTQIDFSIGFTFNESFSTFFRIFDTKPIPQVISSEFVSLLKKIRIDCYLYMLIGSGIYLLFVKVGGRRAHHHT